jgi:PAS domain S-box-containing protein
LQLYPLYPIMNDTVPVPLNNIDNIHQFEALFNFATIGIVVTNNQGQIVNFNKCAETQFGYTKDELSGKLVEVLLPASAHGRHIKYREQYYLHPEPKIMGHGRDLFGKHKDGTTFPVEVSLSHYMINEQTFVLAFIADITVRKAHESRAYGQTHELERVTAEIKSMNLELEQKVEDRTKMLREALTELERSKEELNLAFEKEKELNELKSRFVTVASHEFRTPLSTILSSAYLLDKYNTPATDEKIDKHINRIKDAVGGMKNILEDFLSLGKMEEGLLQLKPEYIDSKSLDIIISDLISGLEGMITKGQQITLINTVTHPVNVDVPIFKNIVINLLSNAIKFTEENGQIEVTTKLSDDWFVVSVKDNGIGISKNDQQHLFERFFRAKNAGNIQGTGLGLHIVSKYLELMKGSIRMESALNEGTISIVFIPQT